MSSVAPSIEQLQKLLKNENSCSAGNIPDLEPLNAVVQSASWMCMTPTVSSNGISMSREDVLNVYNHALLTLTPEQKKNLSNWTEQPHIRTVATCTYALLQRLHHIITCDWHPIP